MICVFFSFYYVHIQQHRCSCWNCATILYITKWPQAACRRQQAVSSSAGIHCMDSYYILHPVQLSAASECLLVINGNSSFGYNNLYFWFVQPTAFPMSAAAATNWIPMVLLMDNWGASAHRCPGNGMMTTTSTTVTVALCLCYRGDNTICGLMETNGSYCKR